MPNHLQSETSPYLIQHADNPVDWYPWGDEAFSKARREDKPIFLSIGYSTCHWCHVMARESFEDTEIAEFLNQHFIAIKVDKEERPDIDSIYMAVCQAFTGSGGWPMSIFMTSEQEPFFAGTYFPKRRQGNFIGLLELLQIIHEKWEQDRIALFEQAQEIISELRSKQESQELDNKNREINSEILESAVMLYKRSYDRINGGFGYAPKFPSPHNLLFLLTFYERREDIFCLEMAEHTLLQMYRGGLFDHIGFGFCRYSTDAKFLVPHFEKMLYDNALLILVFCKLYELTGKSLYLLIAERTAEFVLREMQSDLEGGFYSAQDADSDHEEGRYYIFTPEEIIQLLGEESGEKFNRHFNISQDGNFEGKSIPNLLQSDPEDRTFDKYLKPIAEYRQKRCALHLDDKILTAWNALMIAALCRLYLACGNHIYLDAAERADRFIQNYLCENRGKDQTLFVSFRSGKRGEKGFLDDYASYLFAQLALYRATLKSDYLERAELLCREIFSRFQDQKHGGFYLYGFEHEKLILRPKETYDGAIPSGNSLMAWNLIQLSQTIPDKEIYRQEANRQLQFLFADAKAYPAGYAMFLLALLNQIDPPPHITVVSSGPVENREKLALDIPADMTIQLLTQPSKEYPLKDQKTTFYLCQNHSCQPPVNYLEEKILAKSKP